MSFIVLYYVPSTLLAERDRCFMEYVLYLYRSCIHYSGKKMLLEVMCVVGSDVCGLYNPCGIMYITIM